MKRKIVAVVTCDIFQSQKYTTEQRKKIDSILKREFKKVAVHYREAIHTPTSFKVTQGDEFQFVLNKPEKSYEIMVCYRTLVALAEIEPVLGFRSSIGIGEIAVENRRDSYAEDGKAFHRSRLGLDRFTSQRSRGKRWSRIITGNDALDETLDVILMYQDLLEESWTRAQREAVWWRFQLPTYEAMAEKIGVAYQNVQKRLKAGRWEEFSRGLEFVEGTLQAHL